MITIKSFNAGCGDCFLLSFKGKRNINILIDIGYESTYDKVKPYLQSLSKNGESLDLLIFTHIDADHIQGGLKFLFENGDAYQPRIIEIKEIWFNTYRHIQPNSSEMLSLPSHFQGQYPPEETAVRRYPVSPMQGSTIAALILKNHYNWNTSFYGNAVAVGNDRKPVIINDELSIDILSPATNRLQNLYVYWRDNLTKRNILFPTQYDTYFDEAYEFILLYQDDKLPNIVTRYLVSGTDIEVEKLARLPFIEDSSVTNASSIAMRMIFRDSKLLFLADALPNDLSSSIRYYDSQYYDIVKISHHGSDLNTSSELLSNIESNAFLFSFDNNGYKHPGLLTISRILSSNIDKEKKMLFNNFPNNTICNIINNKVNQHRYKFSNTFRREEEDYLEINL